VSRVTVQQQHRIIPAIPTLDSIRAPASQQYSLALVVVLALLPVST
jgi:hypothetical protein